MQRLEFAYQNLLNGRQKPRRFAFHERALMLGLTEDEWEAFAEGKTWYLE